MAGMLIRENVPVATEAEAQPQEPLRAALHDWSFEGLLLGLALATVPISIAVTEALRAPACVARALSRKRGQTLVVPPRGFGPWLVWAGLEVLFWLRSPERAVWIACFLLLAIGLLWRRSKWNWALPLLPLCLFFMAPGAVRSRVKESLQTDFYSNMERVQMLRVGWKMIKETPIAGVGPGRVEKLYLKYLSPQDPVPVYHGHLQNTMVQLAAESGLLVALAALLLAIILFHELLKAWRASPAPEARFAAQAGILGLIGFLTVGLFDYTYGHSLALILLGFVVLSPLLPASDPVAGARTGLHA
jgi:O-antigen ligase